MKRETPETDSGTDWSGLLEFMFSGAPASFVLWGILAYGLWATIFTNWQDNDGGAPWHRREKDPSKRRSWWDWRRIE